MRPVLPFPLALALLTASHAAHALEFTPEGTLVFDPGAVVTEGFEGAVAPSGVTLRETPEVLEGTKIAFVNSKSFQDTLNLSLKLPEDAAYRARMFVRKNRLLADVDVQGGTLEEVSARFYPTGRVTSDGWYEVQTAPFTVQVSKGASATLSVFASGAEIDGIEVVKVGPPRELRACSGANDPVCGAGEFCAARACHDGALGLPPLPAPEYRASVAEYLKKRLELFFGGRFTRSLTLPAALVTVERIKTAEAAWEFWNGFATAIRQLHDWHTKMQASVTVGGKGALPVCFIEGDGDLSHDAAPRALGYPDVLVSHTGPEQNFGLKPGDRLVAVNGMHPIAFMESLESVNWDLWRSNDPRGHAEKLENLRKAIRRWARDFTIVRCDGASKTCAPPETVPVTALSSTEPDIYPECDHRPAYHLAADNPDAVTHQVDGVHLGALAGTSANEGLYGMIWNDVNFDSQGGNPYEAPMATLRANAKGIVLDHRTGNGGIETAAEFLTQLFRAPATLGSATGFNFTTGELDSPSPLDLQAILDRRVDGTDGYHVGAADARTTGLRTALILARDGSASDWFPLGMSGAPNVRLFGRRTAGAFSSYLSFDYFGFMSFNIASGDFVASDRTTRLGYGVAPDEDILPKQSDLIQGRDTVYERALEWVRTGQ